jgi:Zn-dependent protease with chaperone function
MWQRSPVSVESLRSPGERIALVVGLGSLILVSLLLDISTLGIALIVTVVLIIYIIFQQGAMKGGGVAISPRNFPDIDALAQEAANNIGIAKPHLYIKQAVDLNAYALGFTGNSFVVVHSAIVSAMQKDPRELQFVIGHEFTHVKCAHTLWQTIAAKNPILGNIPILNYVLGFFFSWWSRQAELTADRGGLIACRDLPAAQRALARLAIGADLFDRLNIEEFIQQIKGRDITVSANELFLDHPLLAKRMLALEKFAQGPLYTNLPQPVGSAA